MMKKTMIWAFGLLVLAVAGCSEKPEVAFSEYGQTIPGLPRVENLPEKLPLPEGLEARECTVVNSAVATANKQLEDNYQLVDTYAREHAK